MTRLCRRLCKEEVENATRAREKCHWEKQAVEAELFRVAEEIVEERAARTSEPVALRGQDGPGAAFCKYPYACVALSGCGCDVHRTLRMVPMRNGSLSVVGRSYAKGRL